MPSDEPTLASGAYVALDENGKRYWVEPEISDDDRIEEALTSLGLERADVPHLDSIPFIRYISSDRHEFYDCMAESGFPWTYDPEDRSWRLDLEPDQALPGKVATFTCMRMYPDDPATIPASYNESQMERIYDWQVSQGITCFREHNIAVPDPPSQQEFVDDWFDNHWFDGWNLDNFTPPENGFIDEICPTIPHDIFAE
ncbi:hypothetical protein I6E29_06455 [Arcanobacterium haemolyticum]|nr:hypothetical protein [Arcanobacterium haemolyticum]